MLLYHNGSFWRLVLERRGSIFFRWKAMVSGFVMGFMALGIQLAIHFKFEFAPDIPHHFGILSLGSIVAFAVVFRTSLGWGRYWEAMSQLHFMHSKWADAYSQVHAFSQVTMASLDNSE